MKKLFHAGKAGPWPIKNADLSPAVPGLPYAGTAETVTVRPCNNGYGPHDGPLVRTEEYDAHADAMWHGTGVCATCGSNIHRSQLRAIA